MEKKDVKGGKTPMAAALEQALEQLAVMKERQDQLEARMQGHASREEFIKAMAENTAGMVQRLKDQMGYDPDDVEGSPFGPQLKELATTVEDLRVKVEGRNKSAAVKRNMTDADAKAVMTGEWKDLGHKAAGEKAGLTYAQVYSCRLEFTFKHVHKELRESGWVNPWAK